MPIIICRPLLAPDQRWFTQILPGTIVFDLSSYFVGTTLAKCLQRTVVIGWEAQREKYPAMNGTISP